MAIDFQLHLVCQDCGAKIAFRNEAPKWLEDAEILRQLQEAKAWVEVNKGSSPLVNKTWPLWVRWDGGFYVFEPVNRYVECPSCSGKVYMGSGEHDAEVGG